MCTCLLVQLVAQMETHMLVCLRNYLPICPSRQIYICWYACATTCTLGQVGKYTYVGMLAQVRTHMCNRLRYIAGRYTICMPIVAYTQCTPSLSALAPPGPPTPQPVRLVEWWNWRSPCDHGPVECARESAGRIGGILRGSSRESPGGVTYRGRVGAWSGRVPRCGGGRAGVAVRKRAAFIIQGADQVAGQKELWE
jgi:hypothetical protein